MYPETIYQTVVKELRRTMIQLTLIVIIGICLLTALLYFVPPMGF